MQTTDNIKKVVELTLLWEINKALNSNRTPLEISNALNLIFQMFLDVEKLNIYVYDENTESIRDFTKDWYIIDAKDDKVHLFERYNALSSTEGKGFLVNDKLIMFDLEGKNTPENIRKKVKTDKNVFTFPITDKNEVIGIIELHFSQFNENLSSLEFLTSLHIANAQISAAIVNLKLNELMQQSIKFHQAMKEIAKIIESQYELNYIIPLIGEMIDKFMSEPLIYVFSKKEDGGFKLLWPASYSPERLDPLLKKIGCNRDCFMSEDKAVGVFPLTTDNQISGAIIADGRISKLTEKERNFLEQLTHQASITIDKANTYAEILKHATVDALTGLSNRRQFELRLNQETGIAKRKKTQLCCMMVDIDFFKKINDTYGHAAGDKILQDFAKIIREHVRGYDMAARYGGEEFCILLPHTSLPKALIVANRIRRKVEEAKFDISSASITRTGEISITISIGVSEFNNEYKDHKQLYKDADTALYQAKKEGRNRVVVFENNLKSS